MVFCVFRLFVVFLNGIFLAVSSVCCAAGDSTHAAAVRSVDEVEMNRRIRVSPVGAVAAGAGQASFSRLNGFFSLDFSSNLRLDLPQSVALVVFLSPAPISPLISAALPFFNSSRSSGKKESGLFLLLSFFNFSVTVTVVDKSVERIVGKHGGCTDADR